MCKSGTLAIIRMKISPRTSWRVIGVYRYFTHLVNRVDYRHALPFDPIASTYRACPAVHRRADGVGMFGDARMEDWIVIAGISGFDD